MKSMRALASGSAFAAALLLAPVPSARADYICGRPKGTPEQLYERLAKVEKLREMRRSDEFIALEDGSDGTLWTFTQPAHPAHPAAICRRVMERRSRLDIPMVIVCDGPETACNKLKADFDALNTRMVEDLYRQRR